MKNIFLTAVVLVAGASFCFAEDAVVTAGKKVKMDYTLTVNNEQVETSVGKKPLEFIDGSRRIISGSRSRGIGRP